MPFGLCNALSTFKRLTEGVLKGLGRSCLVCLDGVVIFGQNEEQLLERMDQVFERLSQAHLKIKPKQCHFFALMVNYLGHVISAEGIQVSPKK